MKILPILIHHSALRNVPSLSCAVPPPPTPQSKDPDRCLLPFVANGFSSAVSHVLTVVITAVAKVETSPPRLVGERQKDTACVNSLNTAPPVVPYHRIEYTVEVKDVLYQGAERERLK